VLEWRNRYTAGGIGALQDLERSGRPPVIDDAAVVVATLQAPPAPDGETHWSCRTMAKKVGVSPATVQRVWSGRGLKPHLVKTFKLSNDPRFEEKLLDVVGLYLDPPVRHEAPTDRVG